MTTDNLTDIPLPAMRALHSGFVDTLATMDPLLRDSFLARLGGIDFPHFMVALADGRFELTRRIEDDLALLGVAVTTTGRLDSVMFEMEQQATGVDAQWLIAAGLVDLDAGLDALLGGDEA